MSTLKSAKRWTFVALGLVALALPLVPLTPQGVQQAQAASLAAPAGLADPAFGEVWDRTDRPVQAGAAARSWMWGPDGFHSRYEAYAEGPAGQHLVQYFDKSRMEINDPSGSRNSQWFVTNGLLVVDMIAGRFQVGNQQFLPAAAANVPVAGDTATSANAPTYASLQRVASLNGDNRAANRIGQSVREGLGRNGNVGAVDNLSGYSRYAVYEATTGHNIPDVFWSFLNQQGMIYQNGRYVYGPVVDWLFAMGYPITEPYWIQINVAGQERWVLMQAFQRRILTYTPQNPQGWQVEMGNVGRAYFDWRYGQQPVPVPTATPKPQAASITINPTAGDTNTQITVTGKNFPAGATVTLGVERADANYFRNLANVSAKGDGTFTAKITVPVDAARLGEVNITAAANSGKVKATAKYTLGYAPNISTAPSEVVNNGVVNVQGEDFPPRANVDLGAQFNGGAVTWLSRARTSDSGSFETNMAIGNRAVGTTFKVVAVSDGGFKATTTTTHRVLAQPSLQVSPGSGPAGVNVTLIGRNWPAGRAVTLGTRSSDSEVTAWVAGQVVADGAGNFSATVYVGPQYAEKAEVRLIAYESISTYRMEAAYRITGTPPPPPATATVSVSPNVIAIGQIATATGANWQAGGLVQVGVGRPGMGVEEWLGTVAAAGDRSFSMTFTLGPQWTNAGQLMLTAIISGVKSASTPIWVVASGGRIVPAGLPMTINTYTKAGINQAKINSNGWAPGSVVHLSVVSADGSVNAEMTTATANNQGVFSAGFNLAGPWMGRPDLGIRAFTVDGTQYSLRYLPMTSAVKQQGNVYRVTGYNWPANTHLDVVVGEDNGAKGEGYVAQSITTDANGAFSFTVDVPRLPGNSKQDLQIRAINQPYSATFDF